ncbi:hypothetical protein SLEP1_g53871 [Rubroshorea leprosula]|uniref:Uncharacterized protein n=1 Tax=Rubroshorea leprosula TaxID=152421 RepID=A0AAV5ME85_9ROSI|nr:hypothetical protein SLEP1_g53871 [Rubroshorea leprosula]
MAINPAWKHNNSRLAVWQNTSRFECCFCFVNPLILSQGTLVSFERDHLTKRCHSSSH